MCGIAGFIDFNNLTSEETLKKMTRTMSHRGPDGEGYYYAQTTHATIGLGHRRLSIIDLSTSANQPMSWDGLHLMFNGEIYNFREIRNYLEKGGHVFQTQSDTEVILHSWREWGVQCLERFRGMFAIVIYDEKKSEFICIRDRAGVKPFQYYYQDGLFLFASELKAIIAHPQFKKELNLDAIAAFLQYGYVPTPHSIFLNTHKLQPGHLLTIDLKSKKQTTEKYWDVLDSYNKPKLNISLEDATLETERILQESFDLRMVADVPVGVFLSGGYDSTCVTALLQKSRTQKLKTFTIGVEDKSLNEAHYAKETAAFLGTDHTEYYCTEKEALDIIPELPFFYDEPFADSSAIPTTLVSRLARKEVTVALSADAGDEIFGGYNRYDFVTRVKKKIDQIPGPIRKSIGAFMEHIPARSIPILGKHPLFSNRYEKGKRLFNNSTAQELLHQMNIISWNGSMEHFFSYQPKLISTNFSHQLDPTFQDDLSQLMAVDFQTYMLDDILQKVDRATMSTSLEGREPFLDQNIIQYVAQLPNNYKLNSGIKKYILRQIVHKYVPESMMNRPKMGFGIPIERWLRNELKQHVIEHSDFTFIAKQGLFNPKAVCSLIHQFYQGKTNLTSHIWYFLMFQMWYRRWIG